MKALCVEGRHNRSAVLFVGDAQCQHSLATHFL